MMQAQQRYQLHTPGARCQAYLHTHIHKVYKSWLDALSPQPPPERHAYTRLICRQRSTARAPSILLTPLLIKSLLFVCGVALPAIPLVLPHFCMESLHTNTGVGSQTCSLNSPLCKHLPESNDYFYKDFFRPFSFL